MAICAALAITEAGPGASKLHLTRGRGNTIASRIVSCASRVNSALDCCPLMITRGRPQNLCAYQRSHGHAYTGGCMQTQPRTTYSAPASLLLGEKAR